ncbi:MAG: hypothetical protein M3083_08620 [Actinomycetota bacterium]|nr:hypothetical protein [Actinomycetota bacterium]
MSELRKEYHHQLEQITSGVSVQIAVVEESVAAANAALLSGDEEAVKIVAARRLESVSTARSVGNFQDVVSGRAKTLGSSSARVDSY